jgi:hypothetical protein
MPYSIMTLDRRVTGHWSHLLMAWDRALELLRAGQLRVAIVDASSHAIVMVLGAQRKAKS